MAKRTQYRRVNLREGLAGFASITGGRVAHDGQTAQHLSQQHSVTRRVLRDPQGDNVDQAGDFGQQADGRFSPQPVRFMI